MKLSANILIIDELPQAQLMATHIKRQFTAVHVNVIDSHDALMSCLLGQCWDVVICEPGLAHFDLVNFLSQIRLFSPDTLILIYSNTISLNEDETTLFSLGIQELLDKLNPVRSLAAISRTLEQVSLKREKLVADQRIEHLTHYDALTNLPNRAYFGLLCNARLKHLKNINASGVLFYLDIQGFNRINEIFGYAFGDAAINECANRLRKIQKSCLLGRLGQDEFVIFNDQINNIEDAEAFASRILYEFDRIIEIENESFYLNFNIGLANFPEHGDDANTLIKNAESAMFVAKKKPEKFFHAYSTAQRPLTSHVLAIETALHHVEQRNELFLNFQPFYDIQNDRLIGAETLLRWKHPKYGMIPPVQFIPVADESQLIIPIGQWVLEQTCIQLKNWQQQGFNDHTLAFNVSPIQFRDQAFLPRLLSTVRASGIDPTKLEIEITESATMHEPEHIQKLLKQIKNAGIKIAMDDFGTGYSCLAHLKTFPIDILKIDRSFVKNIEKDAEEISLIKMIVALGKARGMEIHAEGVENFQQLAILQTEGCDRVQGFLFSQPINQSQFELMLTQSNLRKDSNILDLELARRKR